MTILICLRVVILSNQLENKNTIIYECISLAREHKQLCYLEGAKMIPDPYEGATMKQHTYDECQQ